MPSLADLANQINNTLTQIQTNTSDTSDTAALIKGDTADIKTRLDTLISGMTAGFSQLQQTIVLGVSFLGAGLFAMLETQRATNSLLATNNSQNDTIICWLHKSADLLCAQLRTQEQLLHIEEQSLSSLQTLQGILELAHAREFVEYARVRENARKIAACCDKPPPQAPPCFEPCEVPRVVHHDPKGQDWDGRFDPQVRTDPKVG